MSPASRPLARRWEDFRSEVRQLPASPSKWRGKVYQNVTVVDINDGETVTVGALAVTKGITIAYTHYLPLNSNQFLK